MKTFHFAIILILMTYAIGTSATIYVPDDYSTIQGAVSAALAGDTVIVRPGTYIENVDFLKKSITLRSEEGPDVTSIDGNASGSVVTFKSNETLDSVLDGFTLTNGSGTIDPDHPEYLFMGGGIYCKKSSPTIMNNVVTGNVTDNSAGIVCGDGANPKIMKNMVYGNKAVGSGVPGGTGGGGIGMGFNCAPEVVGNLISENEAVDYGGGLLVGYNCSPTIKNNTIIDNHAGKSAAMAIGGMCTGTIESNVISNNSSTNFAGGIGIGDSTFVVSNNLIYANTAGSYGGGFHLYSEADVTMINNTIVGNSAANGGGISCEDGSSCTVVNTLLWKNSAKYNGQEAWVGKGLSGNSSTLTISYSDVFGGKASVYVQSGCTFNWGTGMIDADPLFVDEADFDFHLTFTSPCKDAGDNSVVTELHDFEGDPRIAYGTVDMGADEFYTHLYWTGNATPGGNVEVKFVGLPGASPLGLFVGFSMYDPPLKSMWGDWYVAYPWILFPLGAIPGPNGVLALQGTLPGTPPGPYALYMQALIGAQLSNLCILEVN